jgi:simple sugar transport system ATP-binding protein
MNCSIENSKYNLNKSKKEITRISKQYGFDIDPEKKIYTMSVSEKQTVEILKVLYRGADILILDEPTAVLTPQETENLFNILRKMRDDGKCIIIITHKLHEVLSLSDKVAVLRKGEYVGTVNTSETSESELTEMMVGKKIELNIQRTEPTNTEDRLVVNSITCVDRTGTTILDNVSSSAKSGMTEVKKENEWFLLPQRFPVQIKITDPDELLTFGASAYVSLDIPSRPFRQFFWELFL